MSGSEAPGKVSVGMTGRYMSFRRVVVALAVVAVGLTVHGAGRVPETGPLIVASNHRRYLDPFYVSMAVPRRIQWMGKSELFVFPFRRILYLLGCFPVDRKGGGRAALRAALRYLDLGAALGIFPEGTRRREGHDEQEAPKNGAVMLASRSGAPVLPVHVGPIPNPLQRLRGGCLEIHVGEPRRIGVGSGGARAYGEISGDLVRDIYALPREGG